MLGHCSGRFDAQNNSDSDSSSVDSLVQRRDTRRKVLGHSDSESGDDIEASRAAARRRREEEMLADD